jgi:hypothetical protein
MIQRMIREVTTPRLRIVLLQWGAEHREANLAEARRIAADSRAHVMDICVVENKAKLPPGTFIERSDTLAGDNRAREFSGWDVGVLDSVRRFPLADGEVFLFINDTFVRHRRVSRVRRWRFARWIRQAADVQYPMMIGETDRLEPPLRAPLGTVGTYVGTFAFAMNVPALRLLSPFLQMEERLDACLSNNAASGLLDAACVSPEYKQFVEGWILQKGRWYGAEQLTSANFEFLRLKAKSIVYEHGLACSARAKGVEIRDIYAGTSLADKLFGAASYLLVRRLKLGGYQRSSGG